MSTITASAPRFPRLRALKRQPALIGGGIVLLVIFLGAIAAPWISPYDPLAQDLLTRQVPPVWHADGSWSHILGTDALGRDMLSRLIHGARISLMIGIGAATLSCLIGTTLGVIAGYFGGRVDTAITFLISARLSMPIILVALAVVALAGSSFKVVILVLGFLLWDRFALVIRATTQQLRNADFVTAAYVQGLSSTQVILYEVLPNLMTNLLVVFSLEVAQSIIVEAALSFLGLGVPPPAPSWGRMVAEGKAYIQFDSWMITIPGLALFTLVLAINYIGDGFREMDAYRRGR